MKRIRKLLLCLIVMLSFTLIAPIRSEAAVKISKKSVTLIKGQTTTLKITGTKSKIIWSSNKTSVATVSSKGKVTAKKKGTATITAKIGKKKYNCKVTVEDPQLSKTKLSVNVGKTATLKLSGTKQKITWKSSDSKVAMVSSNGKITAKKAGTATISATVLKKKYSCKVTVEEPETYSLPVGQTIYNKNGLVLKTTNITFDSEYVKIGIYAKNNSNLNLGINAHSFAVNGIMTGESIYYMDMDVNAHGKAQTTLNIKKKWMEEHGFKDIKCLDVLFWAYDNNKHYKEFDTGVITIGREYRKKLGGTKVYSGNDIVVRYLRKEKNNLYFAIRCNGNKYVNVDSENFAINGWSYSGWFIDVYDEQILPGCELEVCFDVPSEFLSQNGISNITKFEHGYEIRYEGDYYNAVHTELITTKTK